MASGKNQSSGRSLHGKRGGSSTVLWPIGMIAALVALVMAPLAGGQLLACPACAETISAVSGAKAERFALSILGLLSLPLLLVGGGWLVAAVSLRKKGGLLLLLVGISFGVAACGDSAEKGEEQATAKIPADMSNTVEVSGTILFEGTPPPPEAIDVSADEYCGVRHEGGVIYSQDVIAKEGKLANVFIYVSKGLEGYSFPTPTTPAVLDQRGCAYEPHVLGIMVGQPLEVRNSDSTLHNVHAMTKNNKAFNLAQDVGKRDTKTFEEEEVMIPVVCDVHGWMKSWVAVLPHPAFAVSGEDGMWSFKVPPGEYTVTAWHERYGKQEATLTVKGGEPASLSFTFK